MPGPVASSICAVYATKGPFQFLRQISMYSDRHYKKHDKDAL